MHLPLKALRPLFRHVIPISLVALMAMTACEWIVGLQSSRPIELTSALERILFVTLMVGVASYFLFRRQQRLTDRLAVMLTRREKLNERYQQELNEREATEKALSDQLEFLQILIDAIPAPIFYKDADGIYSGCNRAFEAFLGKDRSEIIGRSVYGVSPGPQANIYHEKDMELMRQRGHQVYESQVVYADGTLHDVIFNKGAYETQDGRLGGLIGVILDITERKNLERELVQAKEKAEFYSRSKTQFLTNMSHEIRTPLNAIVGFSQVLRNRSKDVTLPADFHQFLGKIAISGQGLAELINDVLDISRIEAGKIEAVEEDFDLARMVSRILVSCEPQANRQQLTLRSALDPNLPAVIRTDRGKLSQILINLIGNAIKFSPPKAAIDLTLQKADEHCLMIEVIDRGIGIPSEQQAIIFEPFEQADKSPQGQSRGTGLGLPITRCLVELLGGEISLHSESNIGTRFRVMLPLKEGSSHSPQPVTGLNPVAELDGVRVLIFEDNPLNQILMQAFCDDYGIDATFVSDGQEGLEKVQTIRPDLIFMDVQLPGLSGIEATTQIRQLPEVADVPIIGLSAAAFKEQQDAAMNAGMNHYLTKPVAFPHLIAVINQHLKLTCNNPEFVR